MTANNAINRRNSLAGSGAALAGLSLATGQTLASPAVTPSSQYASTPVLDTVDVLVVGGGPSGIGAALSAARQSVKTLLVEAHSFFGGSVVWNLGKPMEQMRPGSKARSSIHEQVIKKITNYGSQAARLYSSDVYPHVHYLKTAIVDALDEAKVSYLLHLRACDVVLTGNKVTGVVFITKRGLMRVNAKVVIDCTGDANLAAFSGAQTLTEGMDSSPITLRSAFTNTTLSPESSNILNGVMDSGRAKYPLLPKKIQDTGSVSNCRHGYVGHTGMKDLGPSDPLDPAKRSEAECKSRRQAVQLAQVIRESNKPVLKEAELCEVAPQVCTEITRRLKGLYTLTQSDVNKGFGFHDTVAVQYHSASNTFSGCGIPYRCMVPETVEGLLSAGSGISADSGAVTTSAGNCMATGHAAGLAAALAVKGNTLPRQVNVSELQSALEKEGVSLSSKISGTGKGNARFRYLKLEHK